MTEQALFDSAEYERHLSPWGDGPMPLWIFRAEKRDEIERLASAPTPPPKWLSLGHAEIVSRAWCEWHWRRGSNPLVKAARESIPRRLRDAVLERDGHICQLCGEAVEGGDIHLDHLIPVSRGGKTTLANLQVAHSFCNLSKGARLLEEIGC